MYILWIEQKLHKVYHLTYEKNRNELAVRLNTLGMSQAELSEKIGVTQGIWGINLMAENPSLAEAGAIFEILGITGASLNPDGSLLFLRFNSCAS
jgi:DNA-binding XRE family transcriptional regulator